MFGLYEFLKNFDVIENTTQIKCKLYEDAIAHMQKELDEEKKVKEEKEGKQEGGEKQEWSVQRTYFKL